MIQPDANADDGGPTPPADRGAEVLTAEPAVGTETRDTTTPSLDEAVERLGRLKDTWSLRDIYADTPAGSMDGLETDVGLVLDALSSLKGERTHLLKVIELANADRGLAYREGAQFKARALKAEQSLALAVEALGPFTEFAWSAVRADCDESRVYLQSLVDRVREVHSKLTGGG